PDARERITAYVGNPNDLGAYLFLACFAAIVLTILSRGAVRALLAGTALLLFAGMAVCETLTALIALAVAVLILVFRLSRRAAIGIAAAGVMILVVAAATNVG